VKRLRKRAEGWLGSPGAQALPAALLAGHLRRAVARTAWHEEGRAALAEEVRQGRGVILVAWHGRLACTVRLAEAVPGPITTLTSQQYPGRLAGQVTRRFGLETCAMHDRRPNLPLTRALAREVRGGRSLAIAADGPLGPARVPKTAALDWARLTGAPIWLLGFSLDRFRQLDTWDRLILPRGGGRGCLIYRRWGTLARSAPAEALEAARGRLGADLDAVTEEADRRLGHDGPIA
jgi:lysophospholipid acyltransferase (LPLAT)-like uncharacterized protein